MRLLKNEINSIKSTFLHIFKKGNIYLFGSRVDDSKKGGDIDLYFDLEENFTSKQIIELKSKFRLELYDLIGEQKIDIVVSKDKYRSIEKEILLTGVLL